MAILRSMHDSLGDESDGYVFQVTCRLNFSPILPHVNEKEKIVKTKKKDGV